MNAQNIVFVLIIVSLSIAAIKTVIPNLNASKACLLGYKATCSFTPLSTAILVLVAISVFVTAKRFAVIWVIQKGEMWVKSPVEQGSTSIPQIFWKDWIYLSINSQFWRVTFGYWFIVWFVNNRIFSLALVLALLGHRNATKPPVVSLQMLT